MKFRKLIAFTASCASVSLMAVSSLPCVFAQETDNTVLKTEDTDNEVTVYLNHFTFDGTAGYHWYKVKVGTKYKDIPGLNEFLTNPDANPKIKGAVFKGIYYDTCRKQLVNPEDTVKGDTELYWEYDMIRYKVKAIEGENTEYFDYDVALNFYPGQVIRYHPKYVPEGYKFVKWESDEVPLTVKELYGKGNYCVCFPRDTAKDFTIRAVYEKIDKNKNENKNEDKSDVTKNNNSDKTNEKTNEKTEIKKDTKKDTKTKKEPTYNLSKMKVYGISDKTYTGKNITFKPYTYVKNKKIYLSIKYSDRKNIGKHFVTVSGKSPVTGSVKKNFTIKPAKPSFRIVGKKTGNITVKVSGLKGGAKAQIAVKKGSGKWYYYKTGSSKNFKLSQGSYNIKVRAYKGSLYSSYTSTRGYGWRKMKRMAKCR